MTGVRGGAGAACSECCQPAPSHLLGCSNASPYTWRICPGCGVVAAPTSAVLHAATCQWTPQAAPPKAETIHVCGECGSEATDPEPLQHRTGCPLGPRPAEAPSALATQVGGGHYKTLPIQPVEYAQRNHLGYCEANVVKYVTRHRAKGGRQDIEKAIHYLRLLLEIEYGAEEKP